MSKMVDPSGGLEGHLEFGFSNTVFIVPGIIVVSLTGTLRSLFQYLQLATKYSNKLQIFIDYQTASIL